MLDVILDVILEITLEVVLEVVLDVNLEFFQKVVLDVVHCLVTKEGGKHDECYSNS